MQKIISCIIPVYNEEKLIEDVLEVVTGHPLIKQIIVVNDGSTDNTSLVLKKYKNITTINHKKNLGKSLSVFDGLKAATGNVILFIDADLIGMTGENITSLIKPILDGNADATISLRKNALLYARIIGLDFLSGERAIKKEILADYEDLASIPGWCIESAYLNKKIIESKLRFKVIHWENVISPFPSKKFGRIKGNIRCLKMSSEIVRYNGLFYSFYQILKMWQMKNKISE